MKSIIFNFAVFATVTVGLLLGALKLKGESLGKTELVLVSVALAFIGWAVFRFQKRREHQQFESMRDSALW
jgi:hypothetical protein